MDKKTDCFMLTFGLGGHAMELHKLYDDSPCSPYSRLSGYESPDTFRFQDYTGYNLEGCPVIDKRKVLEERPMLAISMPMCGHETKKFDPCIIDDMLLHGLQGEFRTLAQLAKSSTFSGMDFVEPEMYVELWRQQGARIGKISGDCIIWES